MNNLSPANLATDKNYKVHFFSELINIRICETRRSFKIGNLTDLVFNVGEPFPVAVGLYLDHGWGKPTEFIPWKHVVRIEKDVIFVLPPENGEQFPVFVDQPKWLLIDEHLMGKTILDLDGRRTEIVNDVHLLESKGQMIIVHVDISFNGFLRKWGLGWLHFIPDQLISWRYVQPLSLEDASVKDKNNVVLSVTKEQVSEMPSEDLADALEELTGKEQQAVFSVLDSEKAAETLLETEPRAQRQIVGGLTSQRAKAILEEMSVSQLAELFSALALDERTDLEPLLPADQVHRINEILSDHEAKAETMMCPVALAMTSQTTVAEALRLVRASKDEHDKIYYIYIVNKPNNTLIGVVDLRELLTADDNTPLSQIMLEPAISVQQDEPHDKLVHLFAKYHLRMIPVVDQENHLIGVVRSIDIMRDR